MGPCDFLKSLEVISPFSEGVTFIVIFHRKRYHEKLLLISCRVDKL